MAMPAGIGIIDTLIGFLDPELHAANPDLYMFKDAPAPPAAGELDPVGYTVDAMDRNGVEKGLVTVVSQTAQEALQRYPDRFVPGTAVDPNRPMEAVRRIVHDHNAGAPGRCRCFRRGSSPGGHQRQADVPGLRQVRRARDPGLGQHRRPGAPAALRVPVHRTDRRGHVRLPRPDVRDDARRRAVDGAGRQTDAGVRPGLHYATGRPSPPSTTRPTSSTTPTPAAPTRSSTPATSPWGSPSSASSPSWTACRSATTCGRSSCARTPCGCSESAADPAAVDPLEGCSPSELGINQGTAARAAAVASFSVRKAQDEKERIGVHAPGPQGPGGTPRSRRCRPVG